MYEDILLTLQATFHLQVTLFGWWDTEIQELAN